MKKYLLTLACCLAATYTFAQKIEITGSVHTGIMHYSGNGTESASFINGAGDNNAYTNNPFGSKNGTGFGGDIQVQLIVLNSFLVGVQGGYERLESKIDITGGNALTPGGSTDFELAGSTALKSNFVNLNPYIGYRLPVPIVKIDLLAGFDFAHATSMKEEGTARDANGNTFTTNRDRKNENNDSDKRLRFGLAARYKRIGINANYSHGLTNYLADYVGGPIRNAHTEILRLGVSYQIF